MLKLSANINKIAMFTDIHFGAKQNSEQHNQDCLKFIDFFINNLKKEECETIFFLGDWFESRSSLSVMTINYSLQALKKLNDLGLPIYFIVGNHDLFFRHNRNMHSAEIFREFSNIIIIDNPISINSEFLLLPFLFKEEYAPLAPVINNHKYVFGHLELRNFYLTGTMQLSEHGFLHKLLSGPKYIFSGHYHKRQASDNVIYIGNTFPTSFSDANDNERGMCILNSETESVEFFDYDGPTYIKTSLSNIVEGQVEIKKGARIRCLIDFDISYSEAQLIKTEVSKDYELREFILEQNTKERQEAIAETSIQDLDEMDINSIDVAIKKMILEGVQNSGAINPTKLAEIYGEL
jgi:DNA repair exonuclease SbcCD nuclease subunit